ncbi:hypothetical protein [Streptomyces sp. TR06-5]|uniref:hypothetical protein n=1 Tax=Streptomyces sp. TR06-5 TaxID=3385976 RepID=UPI0039A0DED7
MAWRGMSVALRPGRRALKWCACALAAVLLVPPAATLVVLRAYAAGSPGAGTHTRGRDALWMGHAWVDGRRDEDDLARLAQRVAGTGIRDLYVHAGPLEFDGTLRPARHRRARWLLQGVERELPGVRVQAWLGQLVSYGGAAPGRMPLDDPRARSAVVDSSRRMLRVGFDGVHLNLEPLRSGSRSYLRLLERLAPAVHRRGGVLSVATHQIDPVPGAHAAAGAVSADGRTKWWSHSYFAEVATRVDQVAVMSYDTWTPWESLYRGYVAQQTELALEHAPATTDVLMGLPFYHTDTPGREPDAETVPAAVRGVRLGLDRQDASRERFGVALYVDFAATPGDWRVYRSDWCTTRSARGIRRRPRTP